MAKKKSKIKKVVETVASWVGMGPMAEKNAAKAAKERAKKKASQPLPRKPRSLRKEVKISLV